MAKVALRQLSSSLLSGRADQWRETAFAQLLA